MQTNAASINCSNTMDALYQYMTDCGFDISHLNSTCLSLAMEYVYLPRLRFWRDFQVGDLLAALTQLIPSWEANLDAPTKTQMLNGISEHLRLNALDEANAERLLTQPPAERPTNAESATNWLCDQLKRSGRLEELAYAQRDGSKCGRHALELLDTLTAGPQGRHKVRTGTLVARAYRDAVMKLRTKTLS